MHSTLQLEFKDRYSCRTFSLSLFWLYIIFTSLSIFSPRINVTPHGKDLILFHCIISYASLMQGTCVYHENINASEHTSKDWKKGYFKDLPHIHSQSHSLICMLISQRRISSMWPVYQIMWFEVHDKINVFPVLIIAHCLKYHDPKIYFIVVVIYILSYAMILQSLH